MTRNAETTDALRDQGVSLTPTAFAVRCLAHGVVYLTDSEYDRQMDNPDAKWACPICGRCAEWDDGIYERAMFP